jgi:hypothetical protein
MPEGEYEEVFYPGNRALVSDEHDALVVGVKESWPSTFSIT